MPFKDPTRPYQFPGFRICLVREPGVALAERPLVRTPAAAAPLLAQYIGESDREQFVVALLTVRHRLIGLHTVSVGSLSQSLVHPREVFKPAILAGAAGLVVAHNHPSGDPAPSPEDLALTARLSEAGELLGIRVLDHLIVARGGDRPSYVSLASRGLMPGVQANGLPRATPQRSAAKRRTAPA